ncbi:hypothetical protein FHL15_002004 [Xylaria flabelliformis]|uniref:Uncharacterized protein n=1 Tax=Xylaria flabelliformis TaxID=2512241 RepID=A0A553IAI1_9PEZI|nr:hypothetical protein FHL15_002004 [Xylaria flabelliformis]
MDPVQSQALLAYAMTEQPPGDSQQDAAQSTTADAPVIATYVVPTSAPVRLATPLANPGNNGDNIPTAPMSPPLASAPTSVQRLPSEEHQPYQPYQASPPPSQQQQQQQPQPQQEPPPDFHPYYSLTPDPINNQFYDILGELDPYRHTPKEFINLLVYAATRDSEIAQALVRLNSDRVKNPSTWQPHLPPNMIMQPTSPSQFPSQPWPGTSAPISHPPNTHASISPTPPPIHENETSLIHPRKRKRNETAEQHAASTPATSRFRVNCHRMVMFSGPQEPPPPATHTEQP